MRKTVALAVLLIVIAGCGGEDPREAGPASPTPTSPATAPVLPSAEPSPTPVGLKILSKAALADALLGLNDVPPGFTQDPPGANSTNKTFCDYKPPFEERIKVSADFSNDDDQQALSATLRQYASAAQAKAAFDALVTILKTCKGERFDGSTLTYKPMSVPQLGDGSVGVQIESGGYTVKQNFVVLGPTLVATGGIGVESAAVARLLAQQVTRYATAAERG